MTTHESRTDAGLSKSNDTRRWMPWALLGAIVLFALFLRAHHLSAEAPWCDEVVSLNWLDSPRLADFLTEYHKSDPPMQPVYFTVEYFWGQITGGSVVAMRWLSLSFGLASVVMVFVIGRMLFGNAAGLTAAFCLAVSMPHVYYSQEIRNYALTSLVALLAVYSLIKGLQTRSPWWWVANLLANALLVGTHLFGAELLLAEGVSLLIVRWRAMQWVLLWAVANVVALAPHYLWMRLMGIGHIAEWSSIFGHPTPRDFLNLLVVFTGGRISNWTPAPHLPGSISLDLPLAALVYGLITWFAIYTFSRRPAQTDSALSRRDSVVLLLTWLLVPPIALYEASFVLQPCFQYRYILFASLPVCVLTGGALAAVPIRRAKILLGTMALLLYGYQTLALADGPLRSDMYSAAQCVAREGKPDDLVLVFKDWNTSAFRFASPHPDERIVAIESFGDLARLAAEAHDRGEGAWVIMFRWEHPEWLENTLNERGLAYTKQQFGRWPFVYAFHVPVGVP